MLSYIRDRTLYFSCDQCNSPHEQTVPLGPVSRFKEEFGEYENFVADPCPVCGRSEVLNMNIPVDDTEDEALLFPDLPINEELQRYYVRLLQRIGREDLQIETTTEAGTT